MDGLQSQCRDCCNKNRKPYKKTKEQSARHWATWYSKNGKVLCEKIKEKYWKNPEKLRAKSRLYGRLYPEKINANRAKRHAAKLQRIPKWLTESDWIEIRWVYTLAKQISKETGISYQVDHIIPLQGKNISGLHCPQNLQILTQKDNVGKSNRFIV